MLFSSHNQAEEVKSELRSESQLGFGSHIKKKGTETNKIWAKFEQGQGFVAPFFFIIQLSV